MAYEPNPMDLSNIHLNETLENDLEAIARNIHENWAWERKNRGWGYGEVFDEIGQKHPCMTEYENLPESEKDMDRTTVVQTVKTLLKMGYHIEKRGDQE